MLSEVVYRNVMKNIEYYLPDAYEVGIEEIFWLRIGSILIRLKSGEYIEFFMSDNGCPSIWYQNAEDLYRRWLMIGYDDEQIHTQFCVRLNRVITMVHNGQQSLADDCGIAQGSIARYIMGDRIPNILILRRLCESLAFNDLTPLETMGYLLSEYVEPVIQSEYDEYIQMTKMDM